MEQSIRKRNYISTIFVALFMTTDAINLIVTRTLTAEANFMTVFYAFTGIGIILGYFLHSGRQRFKMRLNHFTTVALVGIYYLMTYVIVGETSLSLPFFVVFVFLPLLIPVLADIDVKLLLRVIFIVPAFGIFRASQILQLTVRNSMTMGDCYALLIPIIAALTYLMVFYRDDTKKAKMWLLPFIAINMVYYARIVLYGSRGPILSVILCFIFLVLFRRRVGNIGRRQTWKIITFSVIIALFAVYFWEILDAISLFSSKIGITIRAIDKVQILRERSTIWNGRDSILEMAINGIREQPILGHGMSTFMKNTGIVYPHNFILQVLYDGGIVLFITLIIPLLKGVVKMMRVGGTDEFTLFATLFFASVPGALFSGDCWKNGCLWLLVGMMIAGKLPARNREIGEN